MIGRKFVLFYFILFILLNIFDFLNMLPADIDFFKKILSWGIIGYLFYSISFTKLFVGKQYKHYDIALLLSYCLLVIPTILHHYLKPYSQDQLPFTIFKVVILPLLNLNTNHTLLLSLLGILLALGIVSFLYKNKSVNNDSFIGGEFTKNNLINHIISLGLLYFITLFFGIIIFNFFMEWFALAIDSVILVIGLLFYIFQFIKHHTNTATSQVLWNISNTGNDFYKELLNLFSKRKTFFIGVSFLLVLHLLVDIGVYMIPYGVGTENTLYFDSLNVEEREHTPLFNIFDASKSQFGKDIQALGSQLSFSTTAFMIFSLLLIYLFHFVCYFFLLLFPFLLFYYTIKKKTISIPPALLQFFLLSVIFTGVFLLFYTDGFNAPLNIGISNNPQIQGVDIYSSQVLEDNYTSVGVELVSALLVLIILYGFINYGCYRHYHYLKKTAYIFSLLFFILYISLYFTSFISSPNTFNFVSSTQEFTYEQLNTLYEKPTISKGEKKSTNPSFGSVEAVPFTNLTQNSTQDNYKAFIYYHIQSDIPIEFEDDNFYFRKNKNNNYYEYEGIYYMGENKFDESAPIYINRKIMFEKFNSLQSNQEKTSFYTILNSIRENIREIFLFIFYIFGMVFYTRDFLRKNIFS